MFFCKIFVAEILIATSLSLQFFDHHGGLGLNIGHFQGLSSRRSSFRAERYAPRVSIKQLDSVASGYFLTGTCSVDPESRWPNLEPSPSWQRSRKHHRAAWRSAAKILVPGQNQCVAVFNYEILAVFSFRDKYCRRTRGKTQTRPERNRNMAYTHRIAPMVQPGEYLSRRFENSPNLRHPAFGPENFSGPRLGCTGLLLLKSIPSSAKFVKLINSTGICPESWLLSILNHFKELQFFNEAGIQPHSWLELSSRSDRLLRLPSSGGMEPLSWLELSSRSDRLLRLPSSGGMDPLSWL